ncbi:AMP-binding protein [Alteromonas ponticola]|uniref:AMP-binding protein n=1 Tax=Alteromonas aquimaris TaxID=2998417 RepID=A0ABT3P809_9ALTE|nr:AMP-binding protein [Alteromonas aquimaris]MCW8108913.1 AMP-binding protein [Alteromonas aquimaris]
MPNTFPLITRELDDPIAYLTTPISSTGLAAGKVDTRTFLCHVNAVAEQLPQGHFAINLCENRYLFMVSFCAVILRGQTNLLPPNKNIATQQQLLQDYHDGYIVHDGIAITEASSSFNIIDVKMPPAQKGLSDVPDISNDHLACISFTSGSTGHSKPNLKYWRTLHASTAINYAFMLNAPEQTLFQLATVPAQHMWGLETSVLMPMFTNVCVCDAKPLFPQDIIETLERLPLPRMLVSTPIHLRALTAVVQVTPLKLVLCATSPLTAALAREMEQKFSTTLKEVYGCSEVGSMAVRRTAVEEKWRRFDGIRFSEESEGTVASADHLPLPTVLQDFIHVIDPQHFTLAGRATDLIKIAGKRGSLFEINQTLLGFKGLNDGVVIFPDSNKAVPRLCAIVSLKPGITKSALLDYLRLHLDSAFIPRPVYLVETLPREHNGKLLKVKIDALLESLRVVKSS